MAIDATIGGVSANSYVTMAEAVAYFGDRSPATDWDAATNPEREDALLSAARRLDQERFSGRPRNPLNGRSSGTTQAMKWPRQGVVDDEGWAFLDTVIPDAVKRAQMELAYLLLGSSGGNFFADSGLGGFNSVQVGPISIDVRHSERDGRLPDHIRRDLAPLLTGSAANVTLHRG